MSKFKNWFIKKIGGYTKSEYDTLRCDNDTLKENVTKCMEEIEYLKNHPYVVKEIVEVDKKNTSLKLSLLIPDYVINDNKIYEMYIKAKIEEMYRGMLKPKIEYEEKRFGGTSRTYVVEIPKEYINEEWYKQNVNKAD